MRGSLIVLSSVAIPMMLIFPNGEAHPVTLLYIDIEIEIDALMAERRHDSAVTLKWSISTLPER